MSRGGGVLVPSPGLATVDMIPPPWPSVSGPAGQGLVPRVLGSCDLLARLPSPAGSEG